MSRNTDRMCRNCDCYHDWNNSRIGSNPICEFCRHAWAAIILPNGCNKYEPRDNLLFLEEKEKANG
jgi:hypothetical protein